MTKMKLFAIELRNVSFAYGRETILSGIDMRIKTGEFIAVIGPSGCGKSTLLRLLGGLASPNAGEVIVNGRKVVGPGLDRAMVFQDYALFPWMDCGENLVLALGQSNPELSRKQRLEIASRYLALVGLDKNIHSLPGELSGGMRQRVAIARALAINSPVLLMDEPFGALDAITRARQQELLLDIWQTAANRDKTIVLVTHDVDEALIFADRVFVLGLHPGHIATEIRIELSRPRSRSGTVGSRPFAELRSRLLAELDAAINIELLSGTAIADGGGI